MARRSGFIGAKAHIARLKKLSGRSMDDRVSKALFAGGHMIQTHAQLLITAGAVSGKGHVPSSPGQPPNNDTGELANKIETVQVDPFLVEIRSNAAHSSALELGASREAGKTSRNFAGKSTIYGPKKAKQGPVLVEFGDSKTAARPFMRPAREAKRAEVVQLIRRAVAAEVRRSRSTAKD